MRMVAASGSISGWTAVLNGISVKLSFLVVMEMGGGGLLEVSLNAARRTVFGRHSETGERIPETLASCIGGKDESIDEMEAANSLTQA